MSRFIVLSKTIEIQYSLKVQIKNMKQSKGVKAKEGSFPPVHSLEKMNLPVFIQTIEYKSPYDITREHRHDYFEILFFEEGGGSQLIDFTEHPIIENSCYIIFPRQIHLMKRDDKANGIMIQFHETAISSVQLKNSLYQLSFGEHAALLFENNVGKRIQFHAIIEAMKTAMASSVDFSYEIGTHYLQALLLQLIENKQVVKNDSPSDDKKILLAFQHLLEENFLEVRTVKTYATILKITEKKLAAITKYFLGLSPLQVIHNRMLLEAKRILLFESTSHKEIAYHLGFDSPATFSQFIKNKTGYNPSELHLHLVSIHK
jgi:AraC-like DNA-binding protein